MARLGRAYPPLAVRNRLIVPTKVTRFGAGAGNRTVGPASTTLGTSWTSYALTTSGAYVCTVVLVEFSISTNATGTTASVTYGGVAMTQVGTIVEGGSLTNRNAVGIFRLFNPPTGAQTVVVTSGSATTTKEVAAGIDIAFAGVRSVTNFGSNTGGAGASVVITSAVNGYGVAVHAGGGTITAPSQTQEYTAGAAGVGGGGDTVLVQSGIGAATITFSTTNGTTPAVCGCAILPT